MKLTSSKRTAWYQKNWEIHWYPETSTNKAKTKSLTRMHTAEKAVKERDYTQMPLAKKERKNRQQMPVAKKERPNHKCWWQTKNGCGERKMAALISQANSWHKMKETKQLKPPQNAKRLPTCKHKVEKTHTQNTPPNHNSLTDSCLQQGSGRLQESTEQK